MAIWCVCFCGMQWRAIGLLSDIPFGTLYGLFARWTWVGLWRRAALRVASTAAKRFAASRSIKRFAASRSIWPLRNTAFRWRSMSRRPTSMTPKPSPLCCASLPMAAFRGRRLAILATGASDWPRPAKHSASPSSRSPRLAIPPAAPAEPWPASPAAATASLSPPASAGVVERSLAWLSRYRRLNTIFERSKEHVIAFVAIAFISVLSRRLKRLVIEEVHA
jgi:hypothetical protein